MRKPKLDNVPALELEARDVITQTRQYELITPLFGGGVTPGETDPVTPIRGTEIRGHLRFWWRATRGGRFNGSLAKMKSFEDELWGAAANVAKKAGPSQVQVAVEINAFGQDDSPFEVTTNKKGYPQVRARKKSDVPPYAAFPLQPAREETTPGMKTKAVRSGISFQLTISYPEDRRDEVEAALWAWETFGGLGARTRRGFGALRCLEIDGKETPFYPSSQISVQISSGLNEHIVDGPWPANVPHLSRTATRFAITAKSNDALAAWDGLIEKLKNFRQARDGSKFGPSLWPEPKAIRAAAKNSGKKKSLSQKDMPRAKFGLPILFHFPQFKKLKNITFLLKGTGDIERLASPLILRPLICSDGAVGLGLILQTPTEPPGGLLLVEKDKHKETHHPVGSTSKIAKAAPLRGKTDVLQAFLDTL